MPGGRSPLLPVAQADSLVPSPSLPSPSILCQAAASRLARSTCWPKPVQGPQTKTSCCHCHHEGADSPYIRKVPGLVAEELSPRGTGALGLGVCLSPTLFLPHPP